ncbi:MAG TPA: hypothetical protein VFT86_06685 [Gaiellaceae bacterium]|nr:hypothetical protein [Gaiellaceae bacterium]
MSKVPSSMPSPPRSCSGRQNWTEGRRRLAAAALDGDAVSRLLGLQVLAQARDGCSARVLLDALTSADAGHREHAAWALGGRPPDRRATPCCGGWPPAGFASMLAGLTLERWLRRPRTPSRAAGGRGQARAKELRAAPPA